MQITYCIHIHLPFNRNNEALYFSRSVIPHLQNVPQEQWLQKNKFYKHVGMYAYRSDILEKLTRLEVSSLEKSESLEQLRWLENGFKVLVVETHAETMCIDTPEDLEKAREYFKHLK